MGELVVLRIGHRPGRDDRMTTHVGLTARALGADRFVLASNDGRPLTTIDDVTERFGGPFTTDLVENAGAFLNEWAGMIVHLTMYGLPIQDQLPRLRERCPPGCDLAIVVGAEKVPFSVYELADWNLAVTNQPHSEVASLAIMLDRYSDGTALDEDFIDATHRVVPQAAGKRVERTQE